MFTGQLGNPMKWSDWGVGGGEEGEEGRDGNKNESPLQTFLL